MKIKKMHIVVKAENKYDPVAKNLFRKTGGGIHKGIKDTPRSRKKQMLKKILKRGYENV